MLFRRFAVVTLSRPAPVDVPRLSYDHDGISVAVDAMYPEPTAEPAAGMHRAEFPPSGSETKVLLTATTRVALDRDTHLPPHLQVPEVRTVMEAKIEAFADLLAITHQCARSIGSPMPSAVLEAESNEELAWLQTFDRMVTAKTSTVQPQRFLAPMAIGSRHGSLVADRLVAASLMADAMSAATVVGRARDLLRVIENGFKAGPTSCIKPFTEFLSKWTGDLAFTEPEVGFWMNTIRGATAHADRRSHVARTRDFASETRRLEFAALDLLFHKKHWRSSSPDRRDGLLFRAAPSRSGSSVLLDPRASIRFALYDPYGVYTLDLSLKIEWRGRPWLLDLEKDEQRRSGKPDG